MAGLAALLFKPALDAALAGTAAKDKPKMSVQTRIALNEAAPDDVELKTRDKVYKGVKTGSAKAADAVLGAMVGDVASSVGKQINRNATKKTIRALNAKTSEFWQKYPWLSDGLPVIRKMKEEMGLKPLSTEEMLSIMKNMSAEEKAAADKAGMAFMKNRSKINELGKNQAKVDGVIEKAFPTAFGVLGFILSPIESLSKKQDRKLARDMKKKTLWKLYAMPGKNIDFKMASAIDRLSDEELDSLIRLHIDDIKSMYSE